MIVEHGIGPRAHKRAPNGILGLLCKTHFPGIMTIDGREQLPSSWEHYIATPDLEYQRKSDRVLAELWVSLCNTTFVALHSLDFILNTDILYM